MLTPSSPLWQVGRHGDARMDGGAGASLGDFRRRATARRARDAAVRTNVRTNVRRRSTIDRTVADHCRRRFSFCRFRFLISVLREPDAPAGPTSAIAGLINPQGRSSHGWHSTASPASPATSCGRCRCAARSRSRCCSSRAIVAFVYRRDLDAARRHDRRPSSTATLLFTTSTRSYDGYWFITLTTALTLTFGMAIAAIPSKTAVKWIGVALLLIVAWRQPARIEDSKRFFKYPQYEHDAARLARARHARAGGDATSRSPSTCIRRWIGCSSTRSSAAASIHRHSTRRSINGDGSVRLE